MKRIERFFILLLIMILLVIHAVPVYAANFGNSPLSTIVFLKQLPNGNILALDSQGRAATFDYMKWTIIKTGIGYPIRYYDNENNQILTGLGGSFKLYNINTNSYISKTGKYGIAFKRNGEVYNADDTGIQKHTGSSWVTIVSSIPMTYGTKTDGGGGYYDPVTDAYYGVYSNTKYNGNNYPTLYVWKYDFKSNSWVNMGYTLSSFSSVTAYINGCLISERTSWGDTYVTVRGGTSLGLSGRGNLYIGETIALSEHDAKKLHYFSPSDKKFLPLGTYQFVPTQFCYDKFGNLFVGGEGGKVAVVDAGGVQHTDTAFYTEYMIHDSAQSSYAAKIAADAAKSSADAARSSSDTAAARSYYSGNTSGYWSYNAYSKANSANTNASNAKASADAAKSSADSAKTEAAAAKNAANTAAANTTYDGKSAAQWAAEAATAAQSGSSSAIYTVTANKSYMLIIEGEYGSTSGAFCNAADVETGHTGADAVLAISPTGSGVTVIKPNPIYNSGNGFTSTGIKKVTIGTKTIYINAVAPPTAGTVVVTF